MDANQKELSVTILVFANSEREFLNNALDTKVLKPSPQCRSRFGLRSRLRRTTSFHYPIIVDHLIADVNRIALRVDRVVSGVGSVTGYVCLMLVVVNVA
ncbi:hypothetical protein JHK87_024393 [Glycine soja]|nr:hypothetical protein JHK87_024393 [Glycine soja]